MLIKSAWRAQQSNEWMSEWTMTNGKLDESASAETKQAHRRSHHGVTGRLRLNEPGVGDWLTSYLQHLRVELSGGLDVPPTIVSPMNSDRRRHHRLNKIQ